MDVRERVPLGRTGFLVSRIGLASGYGVPTAAIEQAVREYGINYLYISPLLNLRSMVRAISISRPVNATSCASSWRDRYSGAPGSSGTSSGG